MTFGEGLQWMKQGKKIKRSTWEGYWCLSKEPQVTEVTNDGFERSFDFKDGLIIAVLKDAGGCAPAMPYQADILAEDWQVVE